MTTTKTTDRDRFYEKPPSFRVGMVFDAIFRASDEETITAALKAVAQRYFEEYTDATRLPPEFWAFAELCSDLTRGLGLDIGDFDPDFDPDEDEVEA